MVPSITVSSRSLPLGSSNPFAQPAHKTFAFESTTRPNRLPPASERESQTVTTLPPHQTEACHIALMVDTAANTAKTRAV